MSWKKWSRFSPQVALLLAVATAVPLAALLWVGWRAPEQDRALEDEQIPYGEETRTSLNHTRLGWLDSEKSCDFAPQRGG